MGKIIVEHNYYYIAYDEDDCCNNDGVLTICGEGKTEAEAIADYELKLKESL